MKTILAIGELVQAAAHAHGVVGPVEFTVCMDRGRPRPQTSQSDVPDDLRADWSASVPLAYAAKRRPVRRAIRRTPGTPGILDRSYQQVD